VFDRDAARVEKEPDIGFLELWLVIESHRG
jgi:hypothetical protein